MDFVGALKAVHVIARMTFFLKGFEFREVGFESVTPDYIAVIEMGFEESFVHGE